MAKATTISELLDMLEGISGSAENAVETDRLAISQAIRHAVVSLRA